MRQNTSSARGTLPFQCFHTCTAPQADGHKVVLFVRGVSPSRLKVLLVAFPQHEAVHTAMTYAGSRAGIHRFEAELPLDMGSNQQFYSFKICLFNAAGSQVDVVWYSSLGMSRECPLFQHCFSFERDNKHPEFVPDLICYQIFPDRFASSRGYYTVDAERYSGSAPIHAREFEYKDLDNIHCGGDLDGISDMLPYLHELGFDGLYLTPVFKSPSVHKFDCEDFDVVDPHFGGNYALKRLRVRSRGFNMRLILNGPFNHTSDMHPWFDRQEITGKGSYHHDDSPYREYYTFDDKGEPAYWHHNPDFPRLNYASKALRYAMYKSHNSPVQKWLREPYGIDGWCLDAASQLGDDGTAFNNVLRLKQLCKAARTANKDCLLLGQFKYDARYVLNTDDNLDGSVNYTGFLSPMRAFFGGVNLTGDPIPYTGEDLRRTFENYSVGMSQQVKLCFLNQLDNHRLPRFFQIIGGDKHLYASALAVMYTWRGIPCVYQGDELGDVINQYQIGPRSPLPFTAMKERHVSTYSAQIQQTLADLAVLRRSNPAFTKGSLVFICAGGAYFGYIRMYEDRFGIVLVNASRQAVKIEQGSVMFPLLSSMYLPTDVTLNAEDQSAGDGPESLLIPLSGRNVRRTDHGEGLEALYELLSRETLTVSSFGQNKNSPEYSATLLNELTTGKTLTLPARSTVVISNVKDSATE